MTDPVLIYSVSVSVDGFINDRDGDIAWGGVPSDELFAFHLEQVGDLGAYLLGRRLYEMMAVWDADPPPRDDAAGVAFAGVWRALPKVVFSRTLERVEGNARLAAGPLADEVAATLAASDKDVSIGGAELAAAAIGLGLVDELRVFRLPVVVGGGTRHLPPVPEAIAFDLVETRTFDTGAIFERYRRR
ncbi:MAG TPA: dihydrofolate reductase family protein [Baekduia sp.]|nr:dihydrofolate reductase family protein [Baekduia sp.]HET6505399.1 dihydrofolate reductase family protein [Baekduia sp.]